MGRKVSEIREDIEETLGFVPGFLEELTFEDPAASIIWDLQKHYDLGESNIPQKYKHLICYAVAAALHCPCCAPFHKAAAELDGATEVELREAALHAFKVAGFSSYLHGRQYPVEKFEKELEQITDNLAR